MNARNLKLMTALAVTATLTAGSASLGDDAPFSLGGEELPLTEAMVDAARGFDKVDVNRDGIIDEDEYAGQRVVYAQLARFSRHVAIDGRAPIRIAVPEGVPATMGSSERTALDAVARRDFHTRALAKPGLTEEAWQQARLEPFHLADANGDTTLTGRELQTYARLMSGRLSPGKPGS